MSSLTCSTRAQARIPGGVDSPVRSFASVGGEPFFVARGEGAYLVDTEGNRYLDYVQSWGASILGHAHPAVVEAVQRAAADGTSFGAPTEREVELAEAIAARVPSVEKVRLVSSGTEAAMTAVRLARGATGRDEDPEVRGLLPRPRRRAARRRGERRRHPRPPRIGRRHRGHRRRHRRRRPTTTTPRSTRRSPSTAPSSRRCSSSRSPPTWASSRPRPGSSTGLRRRCTEAGALLVFDEVITGFRVGPAGAQGRYGITPDLSIFGKVVGGGLPLAAVGGRGRGHGRARARSAPCTRPARCQGNPLATAAGLAVLGAARRRRLRRRSSAKADPLRRRPARGVAAAGVAAQVTQVGTLAGLFFAAAPVTDYEQAQAADHERVRALLPRHARPRRLPRAERLRDALRQPRARRRRHRPHDARSRRREHRADAASRPSDASAVEPLELRRARRRCGSRLRRTWSMKNSEPPMATTITTMSTNASPPEPSPSLPASTSCCAPAGAASASSAPTTTEAEPDDVHGSVAAWSHLRQFGVGLGGAPPRGRPSRPRLPCSSFSRQCSASRPRPKRIERDEERHERRAPAATRGRARGPRSPVGASARARTRAAAAAAPNGCSTVRRSRRTATTAYFGVVCVNSTLPELRVAARRSRRSRAPWYLVTSSNLAKRLSFGRAPRPSASTPW